MSRPASRTSSPSPPSPSRPMESSSAPSSSVASSVADSRNHSPSPPHVVQVTPNTSTSSSTSSPYPLQQPQAHSPWLNRPPPPPPPSILLDPSYSNAPILSEYLEANFVPSVVPQPDEYAAKEQARQYLEKLVERISPGAKLLPFGSMANGFALKNSDMDLCCFLGKDAPTRQPSELVEQLGNLIERETNFYVKMLPRARIPIIKLNMPPTSTIPEGMACDIGFENRLALENTRLLLTYAMVDPRLRTLVLFLKVWTKRRKINNPYRGTLSSYGYVLLVIHFLSHVKQPRVVPNLQRLPLPDTIPLEDLTYQGHDISFFDDLDQLSSVFLGQNFETSGELLIDFFKYFANQFDYNKSVISIRSEKGTLSKEEKGWIQDDREFDPEMIVRDLHKLCIEDPFALDYNVARTVTKDGLYTIRGEFMRAVRILTTTTTTTTATTTTTVSPPSTGDRITQIMNELCAEREDFLLIHPSPLDHHHQHHYKNNTNLNGNAVAAVQPISKSPRRRSAPSPQLTPAPPPIQYHEQQQQQQQHLQPPSYPVAKTSVGDGEKPPNNYDLHRFFQNPSTSTSTSSTNHYPRTIVSLTAPSSPDLTPTTTTTTGSSYYHHSSQGYHHPQYVGRSPYRYPSSGYPSSSSSNSRHASVPRHAYSNGNGGGVAPYPPYPLSSSSSSSSNNNNYVQIVPSSGSVVQQSPQPPPPPPPPAPIFPLEDRERIARASSITFGNFSTTTTTKSSSSSSSNSNSNSNSNSEESSCLFLPPLPRSFAHYHALGGSAAYLSGQGGWGLQPYGFGANGNNHHMINGGTGTSTPQIREEEANVVQNDNEHDEDDDDDDDQVEEEEETSRGRMNRGGYPETPLERLNTTTSLHLPSSSSNSKRGSRSVPHSQTRRMLGPDGRESILFGAIEVTLPKPEDVIDALVELDHTTTETESVEEEETTLITPLESIKVIDDAAAEEDVSPAYTAWRPLSPLFNATSTTTEEEGLIDLDRTPRPTSPSRPLPEDLVSTPPRSKHAAKRARQNERRKQQAATTPPLALTSNSLV